MFLLFLFFVSPGLEQEVRKALRVFVSRANGAGKRKLTGSRQPGVSAPPTLRYNAVQPTGCTCTLFDVLCYGFSALEHCTGNFCWENPSHTYHMLAFACYCRTSDCYRLRFRGRCLMHRHPFLEETSSRSVVR
ncbi:hypothetical protein GE09DRAFT_196821 [Coniochaeta sp. 2T2.1]|nr:hypothetical protein GE09DRAFT_196821 [Coniochaeta sp. 2T2.1]